MRQLIKQFIPPIFKTLRWYSFTYGWKGNYQSFEEANKKAGGYNADHILNRIIASSQKVIAGEIPYERDGIEYDHVKMNYNLLSTLLLIAAENNQELTLIDFGGSLGTTYFQQKPFLKDVQKIRWCIIEQPNYVAAGQTLFQTDELIFYPTIEACLQHEKPQLFLFCNVLQYLPDPYAILEQVSTSAIPYLMIDFVGFNHQSKDRITIQHVPPIFYGIKASYPCWFFDKEKMLNWLNQHYQLKYDFISDADSYYLGLIPFQYEGQVWKLK